MNWFDIFILHTELSTYPLDHNNYQSFNYFQLGSWRIIVAIVKIEIPTSKLLLKNSTQYFFV